MKIINALAYTIDLFDHYDKYQIEEYINDGGRMAAKTKTWAIVSVLLAWNFKSTEIVWVRKFSNQIDSSVKSEIDWALDQWGLTKYIKYLDKHKKYIFPNGNIIKMKYTNTSGGESAFTGEASSKTYDNQLIIFDEAYQFTQGELYKALIGLRGAIKRKIVAKLFNPTSQTSELVENVSIKLPYNLDILKTKGEQFKIIEETRIVAGKPEKYKVVYHHINHLVNNLLSKPDLAVLHNQANENPNFRDHILYGIPGTMDGAIYSDLRDYYVVDNDNYFNNFRYHKYSFGIDWGVSKDAAVVAFGAFGYKKQVRTLEDRDEVFHVLRMNRHTPTINKKTDTEIAQTMVKFIYDTMVDFGINEKISVKVDYAKQNSYVDPQIFLLNDIAHKLGYQNFIEFIPCVKEEIRQRISRVRTWMSQDRFKISSTNCLRAILEFDSSEYDSTKRYSDGELKRRDGADDTLNAIEYAFY